MRARHSTSRGALSMEDAWANGAAGVASSRAQPRSGVLAQTLSVSKKDPDSKYDEAKGFNISSDEYRKKAVHDILKNCAPGLALGVFGMLAAAGFICVRGCCGGCGGRHPSKFYDRRNVLIMRIGMALSIALLCVGFVVGYAGNKRFASGFAGFIDDVIDAAANVLDFAINVNEDLEEMGEEMDTGLEDEVRKGLDEARNMRTLLHPYEEYRTIALHMAFLFPFLGSGFCLLAMVLQRGWICWFFIGLGAVASFVNWFAFAVHYIFHYFLSSICYDVGFYVADIDDANLPSKVGISHVLPCVGADEAQQAKDSAFSGIDEAIKQINSFLKFQPDGIKGIPWTSAIKANLRSTGAVLQQQIDDTGDEISRVQSDIRALPTKRQKNYGPIADALTVVRFGLSALDDIDEIASCRLIRNALEDTMEPNLCHPVMDALGLMISAHCIIGIVLFPAMIFAVLGLKRFNKQRSGDVGGVLYQPMMPQGQAVHDPEDASYAPPAPLPAASIQDTTV